MRLPVDVAFEVQEAINLSFTITSAAGINSSELIAATKKDDFRTINAKMQRSSRTLTEHAVDSSRTYSRIIEWANDHKLPQLHSFDAMFYRQAGVPRDIEGLKNLRFLLVSEDYGITEIPTEISKLPFLQGICLSNNKVTSIPVKLYECKSLQRLDLENNHISRIEDGIQSLINVYAIDLSGNVLEYVTADVAKMPSLKKLNIREQRTPVDIMRAIDTPLSKASLGALHGLTFEMDVKY